MTDKEITIDGLSCDNCPDAQRCQEQQTKKEYAINQVLQEIPSEYANIIDKLKQIIPSITRCDYVLEKQLKRKEQECEELKEKYKWYDHYKEQALYNKNLCNKKSEQLDQLEADREEALKQLEFVRTLNTVKETEIRKLSKTLIEIKEITEPYKMIIKKTCGNCKKYDDCHACCYKDINCYKYTSPKTDACEEFTYLDKFVPNILTNSILQKISEVENDNRN